MWVRYMGGLILAPIFLVMGFLIPMEANISHYCDCSLCCGQYASGYTASGEKVRDGIVAMDKRFEFGTEVIIDGKTYVCEDRGGAIKGNKIDIYCSSHAEAIKRGRQYKTVYIKIAPQRFTAREPMRSNEQNNTSIIIGGTN